MKQARFAAAIFAGVLAASLLFARVHPFGDAGLYENRPDPSIWMNNSHITPEVRVILANKCADCHSMNTHAPVYGRFAPISWLLERDIVGGRKAMNLSLWDSYSPEQQEIFAAKIVAETRAHRMPLPQYRLIHRDARITAADEHALVQWAREGSVELATITMRPIGEREAIRTETPRTPLLSSKFVLAQRETAPSQSDAEGDPAKGNAVFLKRCTGCHALDRDREGPRLQGVYGRAAGSVTGYDYSPSLRAANIVWDDKLLDRWLTDPDALVPGNNMDFHVAEADMRRDLISFLKQISHK
jgi:cytochrome c